MGHIVKHIKQKVPQTYHTTSALKDIKYQISKYEAQRSKTLNYKTVPTEFPRILSFIE